MKKSIAQLATCCVAILLAGSASAIGPEVILGPKASIGLFQPRVEVDVIDDRAGQLSLGPSSAANSFLLDTGASSTLVFSSASQELKQSGYLVEGTIEESGVAGVDEFEVSAPYSLNVAGSSGSPQLLSDMRLLSTDTGSIDPTGLLGIHGIVGMPAMVGRVTTVSNTSTDGALTLSPGISFSDTLPQSLTHRFNVPLSSQPFPSEGEGPLPTSAPLPTLDVQTRFGDRTRTDSLILDSGAQLSIISEQMALDLGLDTNGNGDFSDEAQVTVPIGGVGGTIQAPVLTIDEVRVSTREGFDLIWEDAQVIVQDIDPRIAGVFGADMLTGDGGFDVSTLSGLGGNLGDLGGLLGGGLGDLLGGGGLLGGGTDGLDDLLSELLGGSGGGDLGGGLDGGLGDLGGLLGGDLGGLLGGDLGGLLGGDLGGLLGGDLGGLLGGDLGGGGGLDGVFGPLESHFDQVHFDFRGFPDDVGTLVLDLNQEISVQILNGDGKLTTDDIDDLAAALGTSNSRFDLDDDGTVAEKDRMLLISDVFGTVTGDANLDRKVDFADFAVLADSFNSEGGWGDGDFNGDGRVEFADFTLLANAFGGEVPVPVAAAVPEPASLMLLLVGGCLLVRRSRR